MSFPKPSLPPQPRALSLARLEAEIDHAETVCTQRRAQVEDLEAAGRDSRAARGLLHVAEEHLAQLERSREVLLRGEEGEDEPA